jgi:hypothetical protein
LNYDTNVVWNTITQALNNNWLVGCDTNASTLYGLGASHAYTVRGAYPLVDTNGNVVARLIHVRNPWNVDSYSGPWSDADTRWTAAFKAQVPFANDKNDGSFFIEITEFVRAFYDFQISYVTEGFVPSYYEVVNDVSGAERQFTFTTTY